MNGSTGFPSYRNRTAFLVFFGEHTAASILLSLVFVFFMEPALNVTPTKVIKSFGFRNLLEKF